MQSPEIPPALDPPSIHTRLRQQRKSQGFRLTRAADPHKLIKHLLRVLVPHLAHQGNVEFLAHGGAVLGVAQLGMWRLEEGDSLGCVEGIGVNGGCLPNDEDPEFGWEVGKRAARAGFVKEVDADIVSGERC